MTDQDEMYVCEHCGHATSVASDVCPNCNEPMTAAHVPGNKKHLEGIDDDLADDSLLTDKEIEAGQDDGTVSLDALRKEEEDEDPPYGSEYGNE